MSIFDTRNTDAKEKTSIINIETDKIVPNPRQPRKYFDEEAIVSLSESIARCGIIQPLTVRKSLDGRERYEIIAGERRWRAAKLLSLPTVPCVVMCATDEKSAELAMIENLQREDLDMFEEADAINSLLTLCRRTQSDVAKSLSMSQPAVANKLRLLRFSENERGLIRRNNVGERAARAFLKLPEEERKKAVETAIKRGYNGARTEKYIDELSNKREDKTQKESKKKKGKRKIALKDLRAFYNSIDRSLKILCDAGFRSKRQVKQSEDVTVITITLTRDI